MTRPPRNPLPTWARLPRRALLGLLGFLFPFGILETVTRAEWVDAPYMPRLSLVLTKAGELLVSAEFLGHVRATLVAAVIGLGLGVLLAVPAGIILGSWHKAYVATRTLVEFLRPIPPPALIPLSILLFSQPVEMKVFLVCYATFWPLLFNTIYGVHDVDPLAKETARIFGYGRLAVLARVSLPSTAPFIYTGVKISVAIALIVSISAGLLAGGGQGIGTYMLAVGQSGGRHDLLYAAAILAGLLGWLLNWLLVQGEQRFFRWQPELRGEEA